MIVCFKICDTLNSVCQLVRSVSYQYSQPSSVIVTNYWMTSRQLFIRTYAAILTERITPRCSKPDTICAAIWSKHFCNKTRLSGIKNSAY